MPTIEIQAQNDQKRLDQFLCEPLNTTRSQIQKLIKEGLVTVNGSVAVAHTFLKIGNLISYPEKKESKIKETKTIPVLDIVYEDDDLLVINKPAGLLVHEALKDEYRPTVVDGLLHLYPEIAQVGDDPSRPGIVHRLDKDVSGLMVIAKTQEAFEYLKSQFQERTVKKEYLALLYGSLPKDTDIIDQRISRSKSKGRMVARTGSQEGKEAHTQYDVLKRFLHTTYVRVEILTGRTHQIRVHFQSIGYPVVGDKLYKSKSMKWNEIPLDRLFLHSNLLRIRLLNGEEKTFEASLPSELQHLLETLK
ncbi:RluA family pseudouridine synthase [Candidatus Uhrbacteria bacterium]|nr:RluA family pseudouridine synthase [Candidatus Uhrbacteria bacterium]